MTIPNKTLAELAALREKERNRRLVACWRALEGVPTDWIENYVDRGIKNIIQDHTDLIRKEEELTEELIEVKTALEMQGIEMAALETAVDNFLKVFDETDPEINCYLHGAIDALRTIREGKP